jgi:alpha-L-fucosidase
MHSRILQFFYFPLLFIACNSPEKLEPLQVVPGSAQLAWQKMEVIGFVHFTVNTFTDREWGEGNESPSIFNPESLDCRQWVAAAREAGMGMLILTAKHHDGFCLWPSAYTDHSVKSSPWKNGKGDVVKELSEACREAGLKFGLYLSPWDRHEPSYGTDAYNIYYQNQIRELLTNYGPISEFWMDGAKGENARNMEYDFNSWRKLIYELQPGCLIFSDAGPDIRWIGNESGIAGETNWSMINRDEITIGKAPTALLSVGDPNGRYWVPGECDVSIRPGWFYHPSQDSLVKNPLQLVDLFYKSVGRNGVLLLNIPPTRAGLIHPADVASLKRFREILDETFLNNLALHASGKGLSNGKRNPRKADMLFDGDQETYWASENTTGASIEVELDSSCLFDRIVLMEPIRFGQRIAEFSVDAELDGQWIKVAQGTTIGYKRIIPISPITARRIRILIGESVSVPALSEVALYKSSPQEMRQ